MGLFVDGIDVHGADLNGNLPVLLASTVLSATAASISLAIPSGFNRVKVFWRGRCSDSVNAEQLYLRLNGDTGNDYLWERNEAQSNSAVSGVMSSGAVSFIQAGTITANSATANYFGSGEFTVDGVSDTTNFKTVQGTGVGWVSTSTVYNGTYSGLWLSTAAVTTITLQGATGSLLAGSSASAYGLM